MNIDPTDRKTKNYLLRRSLLDYGMGGMIVGFGLFFAFADRFNIQFTIEPAFRYAFVGLCLLYGGFRMYRGYKKNYFTE
jgi:hypothetical protein